METLKQILLEINALLKKHHSVEWSKSFDSFLTKLDQQNIEVVKKDIRGIYAGMGSFNDLVLYDNGTLCRADTIELDKLRTQLFGTVA
jgi:hypothetical protein